MRKNLLPPYFAQTSIMAALVAALALGAGLAVSSGGGAGTGDASAAESAEYATSMLAQVIQDIAPATDDSEEDEPADPTSTSWTLPLKNAKFPILVGGTSLDEPEMRHRLLEFRRTILEIEQSGYEVGVVIRDMDTGAYLAYAPDRELYAASCIKAPYVASVYECLADAGTVTFDYVNSLASPTLLWSDNDSYRVLSDSCGREVFADWAADCHAVKRNGVRYEQLLNYHFVMLRPRQLSRMWQHIYAYLHTDTEGARQLRSYLEQRTESPIRNGLPEATYTAAKAGWYPLDEGPEYAATNDAGIVEYDGRVYLVTIMTSIPCDLDCLSQLVPGIFSATAVLE